MYRSSIWILLVLVACKPKPFPDERVNKWDDPQLVRIYDLQDRRMTKELVPFLKAKEAAHRIQAALAFASIQDTSYLPYLSQMVLTDRDPGARKASAYAIGQLGSRKGAPVLMDAFQAELSAENQEVMLEAMGKCINLKVLTFLNQFEPSVLEHKRGWLRAVYHALLIRQSTPDILNRTLELAMDANSEVSTLAAHYLFLYHRRNMELPKARILELAKSAPSKEARERLELIYSEAPNKQTTFGPEWTEGFDALTSPFAQAKAISELKATEAEDLRPQLSAYLHDTGFHPVLRNAVLDKLIEIQERGDFSTDFIAYELTYALHSGDMALQSMAAVALQKQAFSDVLRTLQVDSLKVLRASLRLPEQVETYRDLSRLIARMEGAAYQDIPLEFSRPIDWDHVRSITREQKVRMRTSKGEIVLQCLVEDAPASVSNFLKLVDSGFYNDKVFHRVVPQFVIQAGCPRGDGWGMLPWAQRSEFSHYGHFTEGSVGLASVGKDTEGVQFFITPCGTPMLNGRYTRFAQVVEGLDVVRSMEMGDLILSVERLP